VKLTGWQHFMNWWGEKKYYFQNSLSKKSQQIMFTVIACVSSTTLLTRNCWSKYYNLIIFNCTNLYTSLCII